MKETPKDTLDELKDARGQLDDTLAKLWERRATLKNTFNKYEDTQANLQDKLTLVHLLLFSSFEVTRFKADCLGP